MKRPWNRTDAPVYSVSSTHDGRENMHICTYVTAVSMQPKRLMVALYKGTLTLELVQQEGRFILQLLESSQHRLVDLLGRRSGRSTDKTAILGRRGRLTRWKGCAVIADALAWMELVVVGTMDAGDHVMVLCDLASYRNVREGEPLTLDILRSKGLVRN